MTYMIQTSWSGGVSICRQDSPSRYAHLATIPRFACALLILTTITPATAQTSGTVAGGAASYSGAPLPVMVLTAVVTSPQGRVSYEYGLAGTISCGAFMDTPAEAYAGPGTLDDGNTPHSTRNVQFVTQMVCSCWAKAGLVPAYVPPAQIYHEDLNEYSRVYTRLCGDSVAPLGLLDTRPSRCVSAPNFN